MGVVAHVEQVFTVLLDLDIERTLIHSIVYNKMQVYRRLSSTTLVSLLAHTCAGDVCMTYCMHFFLVPLFCLLAGAPDADSAA